MLLSFLLQRIKEGEVEKEKIRERAHEPGSKVSHHTKTVCTLAC